MAKLIVELPDIVHQDLKRSALQQHRTIKELVSSLVLDFLSKKQDHAKPQETGLCGKWQDSRTSEEIVADIKANRKWMKKGRRARG